jgi:hypothetical protein
MRRKPHGSKKGIPTKEAIKTLNKNNLLTKAKNLKIILIKRGELNQLGE